MGICFSAKKKSKNIQEGVSTDSSGHTKVDIALEENKGAVPLKKKRSSKLRYLDYSFKGNRLELCLNGNTRVEVFERNEILVFDTSYVEDNEKVLHFEDGTKIFYSQTNEKHHISLIKGQKVVDRQTFLFSNLTCRFKTYDKLVFADPFGGMKVVSFPNLICLSDMPKLSSKVTRCVEYDDKLYVSTALNEVFSVTLNKFELICRTESRILRLQAKDEHLITVQANGANVIELKSRNNVVNFQFETPCSQAFFFSDYIATIDDQNINIYSTEGKFKKTIPNSLGGIFYKEYDCQSYDILVGPEKNRISIWDKVNMEICETKQMEANLEFFDCLDH